MKRDLKPYVGCAILSYLITSDAFARSLQASAKSLADGIITIGWIGAVAGIAIAGLMLIFGSQNGSKRVTDTIIGSSVLAFASGIAQFIRSVA